MKILRLNGRKLLILRTEKGWSRRELGDKLGIDESSIRKWEDGTNNPKKKYFTALLNLFEENIADLVIYEDIEDPIEQIFQNNNGIVGTDNQIINCGHCNRKFDKLISQICNMNGDNITKNDVIRLIIIIKEE